MLEKIKINDGQQPFEAYFPLPFHFDEILPFYILDNNKRPVFSLCNQLLIKKLNFFTLFLTKIDNFLK